MKQIALLLGLLLPAIGSAAPVDSWYTGFPKALEVSSTKHQLADAYVFEIPVSNFASAEQLLASRSWAQIQNGYFGSFPNCQSGTVPYLVRAVFERTNNVFFVYVVNSQLLVLGSALGPPEPQHRSALVVCLHFQPTAVFTAAGGAL